MEVKRLQIYQTTLIIKLQNLQQENGTLLMIKIMDNMTKEMKIMIQPLNLKQKSLNLSFVITLMHIFLLQVLLQIQMLHLKTLLHLQDV